MRKSPLIAVLAAAAVLLTGCAGGQTVAANVALPFPEPFGLFARLVYGPALMAVLAIVVGVLVIITLVTTYRAARAGRSVRRWPVVVSVVLATVLIVVAALVLVLEGSFILAF